MKVFLSYRRDDTGGRAGRLYDSLAQKYGQQRVFQDVSSATAGVDFTARIESTIADSDAVLVIIGPNWLESASEGTRRIDQPDDFVRREISAALATTKPVVPVLVDGATLPRADQLPAELAGLVSRQAVTLHDTSWHQDVDGLIRQLQGEVLSPGRRKRTGLIVAAAAAVVAIGVGAVIVLTRDGDDDSSGETPLCPEIDGSFAALDTSEAPPTTWMVAPNDGTVQVVAAWARYHGGSQWDVIVRVKVANDTDPIEGSAEDEMYFGPGQITALHVNGASQGGAVCIGGEPNGDPQILPDANVTNNYGFLSQTDPVGYEVELLVLDETVEVTS